MKSLKYIIAQLITAVLFLIFLMGSGFAEDDNEKPMFSMGLGTSFGFYDTKAREGNDDTKGGYGIGLGLIVEKMISKRFGIHSGIWYIESYIKVDNDDKNPPPEEAKEVFQMMIIPLYMLVSIDFNKLSMGFLAGFNFSYITAIDYYEKYSGEWYVDDYLIKKNYTQLGLGGGVELKYKITQFIDIFLSLIGERYLTQFTSSESNGGSTDYLYDAKLQAGAMLRTF